MDIPRSLLAGLSCALSVTCAAQEGANRPIEEVTVYGDSIGLGEVRANVEIGQEQIERLPFGTGADQILQRVSGIQVGASDPQGGGGFDSTINMRGFGKDSIGFSIDGIPNGRTTLGGGAVPNRFLDTANLSAVSVSQSAGAVGSPSRQALVGHINYVTQDPLEESGMRVEGSLGDHDSRNYFVRYDTGEFSSGTSAYVSFSHQDWDVWMGKGKGDNTRRHVDAKLLKTFDNGAVVKLRTSYNDRDAVGYNIVSYKQTPCAQQGGLCFSDQFAPSNPAFSLKKSTDGYTDSWTGNPLIDRLYRPTRGNEREDRLTYLDGLFPVSEEMEFNIKAYYHTQNGIGRFMNHVLEGAVPNALQDMAEAESGDAEAIDASDPRLFFRKNAYSMHRYGAILGFSGEHSSLLNWRAGAWYESYARKQKRTWHKLLNESTGDAWNKATYFTSEDRKWKNRIWTLYASNKSVLMNDRLTLEYGLTYMDNKVDYKAPIHDSNDGAYNYVNKAAVNSGLLPKLGAVFSLTDATEVFGGYAKNAATVSDAVLEEGAGATLAAVTGRIKKMDESRVFDLGIRHSEANFAVGAQVFLIKSDEILAADAANSLSAQNLGHEKQIRGIELTFDGTLGNFDLYASYTRQRHKYILDKAGLDAQGNPQRGYVRDGKRLVGIPDDTLFAELIWKPEDKFSLAVNAHYVSDRAGFYGNPNVSTGIVPGAGFVRGGVTTSSDERIPGYTVWGLSAEYTAKRYSVNLGIENLTDKRYLSGVAPELLGVDRKWAGRYFVGAPRTISLTFKADFW